MAKIVSIQILRGLAATAVVANHVWRSPQGGLGLRDTLQVPYFAHLGVMVFFCISGMLMVLTTRQSAPGLGQAMRFMRLRVERIYPVYILWLTVLLALAALAAAAGSGFLSDKLDRASLEVIARNYLLMPGLPGENYATFIPQAWTLVYEMYFYVIFAICLALVSGRRVLLTLCAAIGLPVVLGYSLGYHADRLGWVNIAYIITDPLVLNFVMGALFGAWLQDRRRQGKALPLGDSALKQWALVAVAMVVCMAPTPEALSFIRNTGSILLLIAASFLVIRTSRIVRGLDFLGDASYSIYVSHVIFAIVAYQAETKLPIPRDVTGILLTALAVIVGCLSYKLFEQPVGIYLRNRRLRASSANLVTALVAPQDAREV